MQKNNASVQPTNPAHPSQMGLSSLPQRPPVDRTAGGLRSALFDEMDALRAGTSTPARARAMALLANSVVSSVVAELEVHKYASDVRNMKIALGDLPLVEGETA